MVALKHQSSDRRRALSWRSLGARVCVIVAVGVSLLLYFSESSLKTAKTMLLTYQGDPIEYELDEKNGESPLAEETPMDEGPFKPFAEGCMARKILYNKTIDVGARENRPKFENSLKASELSKGFHVVTTFFRGSYREKRFREILATLVSNLENPHVSAVHLLYEGKNAPTTFLPDWALEAFRSKILQTKVDSQPTYSQLFEYANRVLKRGSVAVVTNADIYFDASVRCIKGPTESHPKFDSNDHLVYTLTRRHSPLCGTKNDHDKIFDMCVQYVGSHDAFVFAPPVSNRVVKNTDHTQNQGYGAENIVIWEFQKAGDVTRNPCRRIHGLHLHCARERHYKRSVFVDGWHGGPYKLRHGTQPTAKAKSTDACGETLF